MSDISSPTVSVVVLSFDRPAMLRRALASIAVQTWADLEVIVVANRSVKSEEIAAAASEFPRFRLVAIPRNSGFTGGMNRGVAEATGELVYLTQEDIELQPDCIELLVQRFRGTLAAPLMIDEASSTIRCAGGWFALEPLYAQRDYGEGRPDQGGWPHSYPVSFIPGNMVFGRRAELLRLGPFRSDFFMYYDDVELCARVLREGGRIEIIPAAKILNLDPPSRRAAPPLLEYHKLKNFFLVYLLHADARVLPSFLARYAVLSWLRSPFSLRGRLQARAMAWVALHLPRILRDRWGAPGLKPAALRELLRREGAAGDPASR